MNTLGFIAALVVFLARPMVVLLVVLLRRQLGRVLVTLSHFRDRDLELDIGSAFSEVKSAPERAEISKPAGEELELLQSFRESETVIEVSPAAIASLWSVIERQLSSAVMRLAISSYYPPVNSTLQNIPLLRNGEWIDAEMDEIIERKRQSWVGVLH
jgi:hypothetical protein